MNRMDKLSPPGKDDQIFAPLNIMNPNIYYNPLLNQNILLRDQSSSISQANKNFNSPQPKNNSKNSSPIEISLISLLNAISDFKSKNTNIDININNNQINQVNQINQINEFNQINQKKEISNRNESISSDSEKQGDSYAVMELLTQKTKRNQKCCNACPHRNAPHYAKGMCSNCYHSRGRKKKPWKCPHLNKFHYAHGLCQNCYQMKYMKKQNDDGIKVVQSNSNIDFEELSNSFDDIKEKSESINKRGKSNSNRHSKKKLINK